MRLFITGINGLIGSAAARMAIERGHQILGLQRNPDAPRTPFVEYAPGDMAAIPWAKIERFRPDTVLHLAWTAAPGKNFEDAVNGELVRQSDALFRGLARRGVNLLAGTGTFIEYATSGTALEENASPLAPLNLYAGAKAETRENLRRVAESAGLDWTWFRVFNAYGPGENAHRFVSAGLLKLGGGQTFTVKTPASIRDYVQVEDVAHGMLLTLEQRLGGPVNIGSGQGISMGQLALELADVTGSEPSLVEFKDPPEQDIMPSAIANSEKLRSTGWEPRIPLREGLRNMWEAIR